jgi:cancer susceptibility candidate protein 1
MVTYRKWSMRPTSPGESCIISITPNNARFGNVELEAGDGWCRLVGPNIPELNALRQKKMSSWALLNRLSACGIHLMPEDRDCFFVEIDKKEANLEAAFCKDLALLAPAFMVASSKWNKDISKDDCMGKGMRSPTQPIKYQSPCARDSIKCVLHYCVQLPTKCE